MLLPPYAWVRQTQQREHDQIGILCSGLINESQPGCICSTTEVHALDTLAQAYLSCGHLWADLY